MVYLLQEGSGVLRHDRCEGAGSMEGCRMNMVLRFLLQALSDAAYRAGCIEDLMKDGLDRGFAVINR